MHLPSLAGRAILVVEDEALIALDITQALEAAGAAVTTTNTLKHALILVEHDGLCGAILDHALGDGDSSLLCSRLSEREIPFLIYSGHATVGGACQDALHISKPAAEGVLVAAMEGLIRGASIQQTEISPLLIEQRKVGDAYRVTEKEIEVLNAMIAARNVDPADCAEMEAAVATRTSQLMQLGRRMLELDASVAIASLRPS